MIKKISILGSTGSIGTQALDVVRKLNLEVSALAANSNIRLLEEQIREFKPSTVAVFDENAAVELKKNIKDLDIEVKASMDGLCEVASIEDTDMVLNSVVGMVGLKPTLSAIKAKKNIALANKETLVAGGKIIMEEAKKQNVSIYPVDSEHSAIFQCLQGAPKDRSLKKIILTASGGPFFGKDMEFLRTVTPKDALKHPNWNMGAKITIDSASMMNKGLEIIEAAWLFNMPIDNIDVVIHRESIIHSLIEYNDNSVIAQLGLADMRIPIQYAITYPNRYPSPVKELDLTDIAKLSFYKPDYDNFTCLNACKKAFNLGGTAPAIANAANEEAVKLFLENKISFLDIGSLVNQAINHQKIAEINDLDDVLNADKASRLYIKELVSK